MVAWSFQGLVAHVAISKPSSRSRSLSLYIYTGVSDTGRGGDGGGSDVNAGLALLSSGATAGVSSDGLGISTGGTNGSMCKPHAQVQYVYCTKTDTGYVSGCITLLAQSLQTAEEVSADFRERRKNATKINDDHSKQQRKVARTVGSRQVNVRTQPE